jgi:hypothetical protein
MLDGRLLHHRDGRNLNGELWIAMDVSLDEQELEVICDALQKAEGDLAESAQDSEELAAIRRLFQRLHTLRTAK